MFCPLQLNCQTMTGSVHHCPNLDQCFERRQVSILDAIVLWCLNQQLTTPEAIATNRYRLIDYLYELEQQHLHSRQLQFSLSQNASYPLQFIYNQDYQTRDRILFGQVVDWDRPFSDDWHDQSAAFGGLKNFYFLTISQLEELIGQRFADLRRTQNSSPTIGEFLEFTRRQKAKGFEFYFEGYAVHPRRSDYRVAIEGIIRHGICPAFLRAEVQAFAAHADELNLEDHFIRAWWD